MEELEKENDELKKILELKDTLSEYQKINATVVNRNVGYWYDTITIDKGESSGIVIEGISENVDIKEGAMVTTTGMSSIFPSGILIGYIKGVKKDNFDLTMLALAKASYNVDNITYVSVLKRNSETE